MTSVVDGFEAVPLVTANAYCAPSAVSRLKATKLLAPGVVVIVAAVAVPPKVKPVAAVISKAVADALRLNRVKPYLCKLSNLRLQLLKRKFCMQI